MDDAISYARFSPRPKKKKGKLVLIQPTERIEFQLSRNRAYCQMAGLNPLHEIAEPYTSAHHLPLADRPEGRKIPALIASGVRHIVTPDPERIFRNVLDGLKWLIRWTDEGITLHFSDCRGLTLRTDTADGFAAATTLLLQKQVEAMRTAERTSDAMIRHQIQGLAMGGTPPYGWKKFRHLLVAVPSEQLARQIMFDLSRQQGLNSQQIAAQLNQQGITNRAGRKWHQNSIARILQSKLPADCQHAAESIP